MVGKTDMMTHILLVIATTVFCLISSLASVLQDHTEVKMKSGQNAMLHCPCRRDSRVTLLAWSRFELQSDGYLLFYRESSESYQNPSFKDRMELKDGDFTLLLKIVSCRDTGIYMCEIIFTNKSISKKGSPCRHYINLTVTASEQKSMAGQTVILPCQAPNNKSEPSTGVKWSRADLDQQYVFLYQDKKSHPENQHPSFKNRVDLWDREMKDGDVSLILKDVTPADNGTYECRVFITGTNRGKRAQADGEPINTISLGIVPPENGEDGDKEEDGRTKDRSISLIVVLWFFSVFVGVICFLIYRRHKEQNQG